jgi:hypothetical protein
MKSPAIDAHRLRAIKPKFDARFAEASRRFEGESGEKSPSSTSCCGCDPARRGSRGRKGSVFTDSVIFGGLLSSLIVHYWHQ